MSNFAVKDISSGRFEFDFAIETDPAYTPSDSEQAYLNKVKDSQARLEEDERQDNKYPLHPSLVAIRRQCRTEQAAKLRSIAQNFAEGKSDADAAIRVTTEATQSYIENYPNLVAQAKASEKTRFAGDFDIEPRHYQPDDAETAYIERIAQILDALARDEDADKRAGYPLARLVASQQCRKETADRLRKEFEEFRKGEVTVANVSDNALVAQGIYVANRDQLKRPLFNVVLQLDSYSRNAVLLNIDLESGLPPPDDRPSQEKQDLYVAVGNAQTVINTVVQRMNDRAERIAKRWWGFGQEGRADAERELARRLLDTYLRKLGHIAHVGLQGPHTSLAKLALNELRAEFTAQQAGRIKNAYVRSLGIAAAVPAAAFLALYAYIANWVGSGWWYDHKAFLITAAGAALGTWLSFSIRRVNLSFDQLAIMEEDQLDPSVRIAFVIGLTLTACLLFWTGVMNVEIGALKTNSTQFMQKGSVAMLIGVLFGISERALATAISGRAATFVGSVG